MAESTPTLSSLEQMNQLFTKKEALINEKLEKLETSKKELEVFQEELLQKAQEVKEQQEALKQEKADLAREWDKVHEAKENLEKAMEQILEAKILQEQKSLLDLETMLSEDDSAVNDEVKTDTFNLDALRASIGIDTMSSISMNAEKKETVLEMKIPELFKQLEKEIGKSYPKWTKLELLPERYCLQFGEKEIRFFDANEENPIPYLQIIVFTRNTKNDSRLLSNLAGAARVAPDWSINTEDNKIVCTMQFTYETKLSAVLKKCNDFIKNYLS